MRSCGDAFPHIASFDLFDDLDFTVAARTWLPRLIVEVNGLRQMSKE